MIHIHYGYGKGKTTSAVGATLRMAGHGKKCLFCQFLKDGSSGEVALIKEVGVKYSCPRKYLDKLSNSFLFSDIVYVLTNDTKYDIIVLDEVLDAVLGGAILE
jgi:cob(I)alamin adenosyltransferase